MGCRLKEQFYGLERCYNDHLYGLYRVAEDFLQDRKVFSVHGCDFSFFKYGGKPAEKTALKYQTYKQYLACFPLNFQSPGMKRTWDREDTDLPARPAICRACDVLMVSICFSPFSLMLGFISELKMIRFILLKRWGRRAEDTEWTAFCLRSCVHNTDFWRLTVQTCNPVNK